MRFVWLLSFLLFFLPQVAFSEQKPFAVLEFVGVGFTDARLLSLLSDGVRGGLIKQIDKKEYLVMTRESILQILKDNGKDASCMVGECEVEIGRNIGAEYVISGSVTYYASTYIVTVKLHNTISSELLSTEQIKSKDPMDLLNQIPFLGERLLVEGGLQKTKTSPSQDTTSINDISRENTSERNTNNSEVGKRISGKGYEAVLIPSGSFSMGCTSEESDCKDDEKPLHKVTLTRDFYMMKHEVTQELYKAIQKKSPSVFKKCGGTCPVDSVSWYDAVRFANSLSKKEGIEECYTIGWGGKPNVVWSNKSCIGWRLPTEAEWEYAARGNQDVLYSGSNNPDQVAWYGDSYDGLLKGNSNDTTHQVCSKNTNAFGLCDMSGNVEEWVWDAWVQDAYKRHKDVDPIFDLANPAVDGSFSTDMYVEGNARYFRGGDFRGFAKKVFERSENVAHYYDRFVGFRLVRTSP